MAFVAEFIAWGQQEILHFGYAGLFLVVFLSSSTVLIPFISIEPLIFFAGSLLDPVAVGLVAGFASGLGEMIGYYSGRLGEKIIFRERQWGPRTDLFKSRFKKFGFFAVFFFAAIPLVPYDVVGLYCGAMKYDIRKFFVATLVGKTIRTLALAIVGSRVLL